MNRQTALIGASLIGLAVSIIWLRAKGRKQAQEDEKELETSLYSRDFLPLKWPNNELIDLVKQFGDGEFVRGYSGIINGSRAAVIDLRFTPGRYSHDQTFLCIERPDATLAIGLTFGLSYHRNGRWLIATAPERTLTPSEALGYLDNLA